MPKQDPRNRVLHLLEEAHSIRSYNLSKSVDLAEEALKISASISDSFLVAKSSSRLSLYFMILGATDVSIAHAEKALELFETLNDEIGVADSNYSLAAVYYKTNNYHRALVSLIDALKIYLKFEDYANISRTEKALGTVYEYIGDDGNAVKSYKNGVRAARKAKDSNLESNIYNNLSGFVVKRGKHKLAMQIIEKSIELKKLTNDIRGIGFATYGRGKVYLREGNFEKAEADFKEAMRIHSEMGDIMGLSMCYTKLGELYNKLKDYDTALSYARQGIELTKKHNITMINIKLYNLVYSIYKIQNKTDLALENLEYYIKEKEAVIDLQTQKVIENYDFILKMKTLEKESELQKEKQILLEKKSKDDKKAIQLRQKFLSVMSHEIRTPLNAITTIISLLKTEVTNEGLELLQNLQFASKNLIHIVNDVLDFTKLDSDKAKLELYPISLKSLCKNIIDVYRSSAVSKGIELEFVTNVCDACFFNIDETKLTQILSNLISNAIKFTDYGSVTLKVNYVEGSDEKRVLFEIIDSGEGISSESLDEIFVSFSQLKPVMTRKQGGTGLGLAIVKKLVELHRSNIKVTSKKGVGSNFFFELNLEKRQPVVQETSFNLSLLQDKKALIVEDTIINAVLLKKLLSKWGIESIHVESGKKALELINIENFDFILMDIHMPEMNGFEATKSIRTIPNKNFETPIFALTADTRAQSEDFDPNHFNGFLWKPFEIDQLSKALLSVV